MPATLVEIIVPVCASLGGAMIVGYASFLVGRGTRSHEWRLTVVRDRMLDRRQLYAKFLTEADRNVLSVAAGGDKSIDNVMPLFAMLSEISLLGSNRVRDAAKQLCDSALMANAQHSGNEPDNGHFTAKTAFLNAARDELASLEAGVTGRRVSWDN